MVFRDGDAMLDACAILGDGYDPPLWRTPMLLWAFDGITRVTASYDAGGRITSYECDCGLDEPFGGTIEWNDDGRVTRLRGRYNLEMQMDRRAVYRDGELAAHEFMLTYDTGGPVSESRIDYGRDATGRLSTVDSPGAWGPSHYELAYDGNELVTVRYDGFSDTNVAESAETTYLYDSGGQLTGTSRISDPDADPGPEVVTIDWLSDTEAHIVIETGATIDVVLDESGRLIRKDMRSEVTGHKAMTWEWDDEGRLVEFWMYGE